jgi:hypothetical protein
MTSQVLSGATHYSRVTVLGHVSVASAARLGGGGGGSRSSSMIPSIELDVEEHIFATCRSISKSLVTFVATAPAGNTATEVVLKPNNAMALHICLQVLPSVSTCGITTRSSASPQKRQPPLPQPLSWSLAPSSPPCHSATTTHTCWQSGGETAAEQLCLQTCTWSATPKCSSQVHCPQCGPWIGRQMLDLQLD